VARFHLCDVGSREAVAAMVEAASLFTGRIDVLCNNAAYLGPFHDVLEAGDEEWDRCLRVQVLGTNNCTRAVLPYMLQQRAGSIVNVVSIQAMVGCPTSVTYTAAKSALLGFTLSAAYDYGPHNVRVNALSPGPIQTRISPKPGDPAYRWQCDQTMLGRVGQSREVASAALFLASDESSYITGTNLPVDGGWTAK
jgi:NAD(P)-dependent dehydrogenase (short-subunit alcohol dehydrogenase family)